MIFDYDPVQIPPMREKSDTLLYDFADDTKTVLRYVGRKDHKYDRGVTRYVTDGSLNDALCKLHSLGNKLTGSALEEAKRICH